MTETAFQLSRIFAKGWTAARALPVDDEVDDIQKFVTALNPYTTEPAKSRWRDGFVKALEE